MKRLLATVSLFAWTVASALAGTIQLTQSGTSLNVPVGPLISATNHISPLTGATVVVVISKNGGAQASPSGSIAEISGDTIGEYSLAANATDDNTLGDLHINAVGYLVNPATAPTVTTATTGGTIAAGTYYVSYTYTTAAGQTLAYGTATSITTTGTTSTITVTAPALPSGATGINAYEGSTSTVSSMIYAGVSATNAVIMAALPSGTASAPSSNTAIASDPWDADYQVVASAGGGGVTDSSVQTDVATSLTAQGYTTARASALDTTGTNAATAATDSAANGTAITSNLTSITALSTKLGTPAGASVSADIAAVKTSVGTPQQAGSPVTLPGTAPSGYGGSGSAPTAIQVAAAVWAYTIDPLGSGLDAQDAMSDIWDVSAGPTGTVTYPTGQQVTPYLRYDGTTNAFTSTLALNGSGKITARTRANGTRP